MSPRCIDLTDVQQAAERIRSGVIRTPCIYSERLSRQLNCRIFFKAESLQHIGAFKARGALNAVLVLDGEVAPQGVVTHSSGNHAAALTRAASLCDIPAYVVMPENSAKNKIDAVRAFGVDPVFCRPTAESRESLAEEVRRRTGATLIHPYNHPPVIAGQGTVGIEILNQLADVDTVIAPVGGGGLMAGLLTAIKTLRPSVQVIAAEPELADDAYRSLRSGSIQMPTRYDTVADGLRSPLGSHTFPILRDLLDDILLVSEASIQSAMRTLAEAAKLVAEPSGAVAFGALLQHAASFRDRNVAIVVSGGNLDLGACQLGHPAKGVH